MIESGVVLFLDSIGGRRGSCCAWPCHVAFSFLFAGALRVLVDYHESRCEIVVLHDTLNVLRAHAPPPWHDYLSSRKWVPNKEVRR